MYYQLGDEDVKTQIISTGTAVAAVATDPHMQEVVCHIMRLKALEEGQKDPGTCKLIPTNYLPGKGVGLRYAVVPLRYLVEARKHPITTALLIAGAIGAIYGIGFIFGKEAGRKRRAPAVMPTETI